MSAEHFLDTNILVYSFDEREPRKRKIATALIERALAEGRGIISYQVVQEFLSLSTRKFAKPMSPGAAAAYIDGVLEPLCGVHSSIGLYRRAVGLQARWRFSLYDCLVVAAALEARCDILYSEDLQNGQTVESLTIVDPFADG